MKTHLIKVISFTLLFIALIASFVLILLTSAFPKTMADFNYRIGNEKSCVKYSEKQYEKTQSIDDLHQLVKYSIWAKDYQSVSEFGEILINNENYNEFIISLNEGDNYDSYLVSQICIAFYNIDNKDKSLSLSISQSKNAYENSPINSLSVYAYTNGDKDFLKNVIENLKNSNLEGKNDLIATLNKAIAI